MKPVITLTTDFGHQDHFVGSVKGVILQINPEIKIVDISHDVPPFSIIKGAFIIASAFRYFPKGSIHVVVVDPGVGSSRKPLLVVSRSGFFLAPDNGILSYIFEEDGPCQIYEITEKKFFLPSVGQTFHGRDIFAPVAAWLSTEMESGSFGKLIENPVKLPIQKPMIEKNQVTGQIVYIDHYGNLVTNIKSADLSGIQLNSSQLMLGSTTLTSGKTYYGEAAEGESSFVINSSGYLEIFQNKGNAALTLRSSLLDIVKINSNR
ncbi:MAG: SAM-dependent chlorinase/fluorinase [Nitrospirae bacterium]|nr:SAM-dependent chlorinase/fluorinase [Nitrospirota bacterium]